MEIYDHNSVHLGGGEYEEKPRRGGLFFKIAAVLACVLAFAAIVLACVGVTEKPEKEPDAESAFNKVRPSVVEVYGSGNTGSGVVYRIIGGKTYVITNNHVITGADVAKVRFADFGTRYDAYVLGYDTYHDIALLEIDGDYGAVPVTEHSSVQNGTAVVSVGNNLGYGIAVFDGIVSQRSRILNVSSENKSVPVYAVTASLNPGMSGGGVFALDGKIIGISTYQVSSVENASRPVADMNFCVPYSIARRIASAILESGKTGEFTDKIYMEADTSQYGNIKFHALGFEAAMGADGLKVGFVSAYPPIDKRGEMAEGDIVVRIGSLDISASTAFGDIFAECLRYKPDSEKDTQPLEIELKRGEETVKVYYDRRKLEYA